MLRHKTQVAQRATIAHLRANFTFSYCKSIGDDDPRGLANLDPGGMIGRIMLGTTNYCYTQNIKVLDLMVSEKRIFLGFPIESLREMMTLVAWLI